MSFAECILTIEAYAENVLNNATGNKRNTAMCGDVKSHKR